MPAKKSGKAGIARRYGSALFELAKEQNALAAVSKDLAALVAMLSESKDLMNVAKNPILPTKEVAGAFAELLKKQGGQKVTLGIIEALAENRRLALLPEVAGVFGKLYAAEKGEVEVEVTTAQPLTAAHKGQLESTLKKAVGKNVAIIERVNETILGGLKVKIGSELIDASVEGQLTRLTRLQKTANLKG